MKFGKLKVIPVFSRVSKFGVKLAMPTFGKAEQLLAVKLTSCVLQEAAIFPKNPSEMLAGRQLIGSPAARGSELMRISEARKKLRTANTPAPSLGGASCESRITRSSVTFAALSGGRKLS